MFFHAAALGLVTYFLLSVQTSDPVELVPVDAGFEDRGALGDSFKLLQKDLRKDNAFEKLYKVKGSDGIYVRKAGGLHAVFRNPEYVDTELGYFPIVPAGTVYCIGKMRPELLQQLGVLAKPTTRNQGGIEKAKMPPTRLSPPAQSKAYTGNKTIRFIDDEQYRRQRLTSFVLEIVLSQ